MTSRPALAISLYLQNRRVLLVGVGTGADERARRLESTGAIVVRADEQNWQELREGAFFAVMGHAESDDLNRQVAEWAREQGVLAYAHDQPLLSDFAFPALARRGALQIAISTDGTAPALASRLRAQIEGLLSASGENLDRILKELVELRASYPRGAERMQKLKALAAKVRLVGSIERDGS